MASNIDDISINQAFPVAGQDNDSQGFRDNFSVIKQNFVDAKAEIEALQDNTAKKNAANNFLGNNITNANLVNISEELNAVGTLQSSQDVDFSNGPVQTFTLGADVTLTTTGWPESGKVGKLRLILINDGTSHTLTLGTEAGSTLKFHNDWPTQDNTIEIDNDQNPKVIDLWTYNAGSSIFVKYDGQYD
jgi:hypothetical protein